MYPSFLKGNGPELWVIMLEKIWTKIHGSYDRIYGLCNVHEVLWEITGAPGFFLKIKEIQKEKDLFAIMLDCDKKGYMMGASFQL